MDFHAEESNNYRVEVSGWDARENFFVEKTVLAWGQGNKEILLQSVLRQGCVVFVRLLQVIANESNFPVAYQAVEVADKDRGGRSRVRLQQLHPRESLKDQGREEEVVPQVA